MSLMEPWMFVLAILKGIVMAAVIVGIANPTFLQALAVASCSAIITGIFLVIASYVQARHTGRQVQDVGQKVERVAERVDGEN